MEAYFLCVVKELCCFDAYFPNEYFAIVFSSFKFVEFEHKGTNVVWIFILKIRNL